MANGSSAAAPLAKTTARVKDVTSASFRADVLTASQRQPVLVDFWAPWCGPCKQLAPVLERAVADAGGKVVLVKMNIDEHPQIAGQLGIQSIPALIAFDKGQPIDGFVGALPESQIRGFIERLVGPLGGGFAELLAEAEAAAAKGDAAGAAALYAEILDQDPGEAKAVGGLAKLRIAAGQLDQAKALLATVPAAAPGKEPDPAVAAAWAALRVAEQAASVGELAPLERAIAADADDNKSRFDLAVALSAKGDRAAAADQLLEIIRRDRKWNDEAARKQLLQLFEAWGLMDPATVAARRKLSAIWF
ncbi:MAG TPA: thioredoxin [Roseiarcus sp.]|nr:thioredoxin [Roseiarcus sp.]